ncbi:MAG: sulfite exporter TauE/SafE family protein [Crocinitomicaceae bacterium]|nr:sulfite exporter TauE/SafE family protein [Crocinitomicaceae bacterium]
MDYIIIAITVLFGAGLTFFSGFGLGTLLLPVFTLFFDLPIAIGATAIVHLSNNVFKFILVSKHIHRLTLFAFGIPAMIFAFIGGIVLDRVGNFAPIYQYTIGNSQFIITYLNLIIGSLMIFFAWFDLNPKYSDLNVKKKHLPFGGILSGFFGGISGHQGAFRSAFLSKAELNKEQFVGTSNAVSLTVDLARLPVYLGLIHIGTKKTYDLGAAITEGGSYLIIGIVFAFLGTYIGKQLIQKTTITSVQRLVGILLFIMGGLIISGLIS